MVGLLIEGLGVQSPPPSVHMSSALEQDAELAHYVWVWGKMLVTLDNNTMLSEIILIHVMPVILQYWFQ